MAQIEKFRYRQEVPSRVEAIRMLIGRGLLFVPPEGFNDPKPKTKTKTKNRKGSAMTSPTFMKVLTIAVLAFNLVGCTAFKLSTPTEEDRIINRVIDCRNAGLRAAQDYKPETWSTREIHYNRRDHHCYLNLEGSETGIIRDSHVTWRNEMALVRDVDENRDVASCDITSYNSDDWETTVICDAEGKGNVGLERFEELRRQYLERHQCDGCGHVRKGLT